MPSTSKAGLYYEAFRFFTFCCEVVRKNGVAIESATCDALHIGVLRGIELVICALFAPLMIKLAICCRNRFGRLQSKPMQKHSISCHMSEMRLSGLFVIHDALFKSIQMAMQSIKIATVAILGSFPVLRAVLIRAHGQHLSQLRYELGFDKRKHGLFRIKFCHYRSPLQQMLEINNPLNARLSSLILRRAAIGQPSDVIKAVSV